jgi:phosphinothricin acetyltransferase
MNAATPATSAAATLRPSTPADLSALAAIYGHNVLHGTGTFELEAPDAEEMGRRREAVLGNGLPWIVAEVDGRIVGYAYANLFRPRRAYRFCVEDSIYLDPVAQGRGIGRLLLAELMAQCTARGCRQMLAVIGDSANAGSIALHAACGFTPCGRFDAAGWKFDRWLDVVLMQRALGTGAADAPAERADGAAS